MEWNPPLMPYKKYTFDQYLEALTDDEYGVILEMTNSTTNQYRKMKRAHARWRAQDKVDFNDDFTNTMHTWLVANVGSVWTQAKYDQLKGV